MPASGSDLSRSVSELANTISPSEIPKVVDFQGVAAESSAIYQLSKLGFTRTDCRAAYWKSGCDIEGAKTLLEELKQSN
jgi:hypothetical protein